MRFVWAGAAGTACGCTASAAAVTHGPVPALLIFVAFMAAILRWSWVTHPRHT